MTEASPGFACAKVNLHLHVTGRRDDGYHLLDSLVVFPPVGDELAIEPAASLSLAVDGPFAAALSGEDDNLVLRAATRFAAHAGRAPEAAFRLTKSLPVASGIGGGSADAAAALRLLAARWQAPIPADLALGLGADVPVCLARRPARMSGIGEILAPAPALPPFGLLLVNPGVAVPTPAIFRARTGGFSPPAVLPARWPTAARMATDLARLGNDLQSAAITLAPIIAEALAAIAVSESCLLARMSGSGATCFGLFPDAEAARRAAARLRRADWWCWGGEGQIAPAQG
ncbi:4-(cytidine 5'-diphospho)-2-C-methyl-D-erythritol kinase [Acidiphilium sp. C61]|jgi:4-diphosphocytidyl-2-C-methyl-D-erythritol kinase|uniref:4-(cytidine 5'-diphospho)-2-C-methyl-D-erythritol kinase n=1 Tax=Acidiphilium sp. C61 TaxID=1671485 RepID=UPI00157A6BA3|nr:4-(cytidine 5'-diphospho)-2-C-methyl-D-erythritol kinase [Acidiphilium sp. C61]